MPTELQQTLLCKAEMAQHNECCEVTFYLIDCNTNLCKSEKYYITKSATLAETKGLHVSTCTHKP